MQTNDTTINTNDQLDDGRTIEGAVKEVKGPDNALVVLDPPRFATELFKPFNDELAAAKRKRTKYDITTREGMATAKDVLASLVKIRTGAEKAKTKAKRPIDLAGKEILAQYNTLEAAVKAEEKKHADAIAEENARIARIEEERRQLERARIEAIENRIEAIRTLPSTLTKVDSTVIQAQLDQLVRTALKPEDFQEHLEVAIGAQNIAINELRQLLTDVRDRENRDAELARLRAEEEKRKADAAAAEKAQAEAAAALKAQQDQMTAIMEMQGLAAALEAAGKARDREAVEAAVKKARAFDPSTFGAMAPMASLARDAALPLLEDLLANLPVPVVIGVDPGAPEGDSVVLIPVNQLVSPAPTETRTHNDHILGEPINSAGQYYSRTTFKDNGEPILCNADGSRSIFCDVDDVAEDKPAVAPSTLEQVRAAAFAHLENLGGRRIPDARRPADIDILELVANHYGVPNMTAIAWLAMFDADGVRAALAEV